MSSWVLRVSDFEITALSDGPVVSRLVIPEIGYFDGMSDRANGFIIGGSDATGSECQWQDQARLRNDRHLLRP